MTIGNFQSGYPTPDGITSAVQGLSEALLKQGHQVVIYGYGPIDAQPTFQHVPGLRTLHFDSGLNPFRAPRPLLDRLEMNTDQLDILIIHGMFNAPNVSIGRSAMKGRIPYVICPHCPYHSTLLEKHRIRKNIYGTLFEKPLLRSASAVQVFCSKHADLLRTYGIESRIMIVPNGLDPLQVRPAQSSDPRMLSGDPKLLFLGRLDTHHKGLDLLIRGLGRALRSGRIPATTVLTLVGPDDGDGAALRKLVRRENICAQVAFTGKAADPARWQILQSCDLFVLSSRYDGFAMAVTEAMMVGKPLLLSTETANFHWIRDASCGFFAEPSVESICHGLIEAIERRHEWTQMGERARLFASEKLTWARAAVTAAENYANLLETLNRKQLSGSFSGDAGINEYASN
ncbi:MAG: glycosyltransferase [Bryobacterales bacterium]|nr:glycosyltransferase [Bryobacterales bacterium]